MRFPKVVTQIVPARQTDKMRNCNQRQFFLHFESFCLPFANIVPCEFCTPSRTLRFLESLLVPCNSQNSELNKNKQI